MMIQQWQSISSDDLDLMMIQQWWWSRSSDDLDPDEDDLKMKMTRTRWWPRWCGEEDLMIKWHKLITLIAIEYDSIGYRPGMLRGMDPFPTLCFYDTRGRGRAVLRHAPHVVVMTTVGYPRSSEGHVETRSPCCCDDNGRMPTRRG